MTPTPTTHDRARAAIADVLGGALIDADEIVMVGKGSDPRLYRNEEAILAALEAAGLVIVDAERWERMRYALSCIDTALAFAGNGGLSKWGIQLGDLDPLPATADQEEGR